MITVSTVNGVRKKKRSHFAVVEKALKKQYEKDLASIQEMRKEMEQDLDKEMERVKEFGGLASRDEAEGILGVSRQRVGYLIQRGTFRLVDSWTLSLADVKKYKKGRKVGRPKK